MSPKVDLDGYVEVKERIRLFYEQHPDGRLVTAEVRWPHPDDDVQRVAVKALAYRTADDPQPGVGWSWMVLPGATNFTRGSELENTETSAWGRAIGALGIGIANGIASKNEIDAKAGSDDEAKPRAARAGRAEKAAEPEYVSQGFKSFEGTVAKGDGAFNTATYHQTPSGHLFGFRLEMEDGKAIHEVLVTGDLGEALFITVPQKELFGARVIVDGEAFRIEEAGRKPRSRLTVSRIKGPDFEIPAREAPSVPLFEDFENAEAVPS